MLALNPSSSAATQSNATTREIEGLQVATVENSSNTETLANMDLFEFDDAFYTFQNIPKPSAPSIISSDDELQPEEFLNSLDDAFFTIRIPRPSINSRNQSITSRGQANASQSNSMEGEFYTSQNIPRPFAPLIVTTDEAYESEPEELMSPLDDDFQPIQIPNPSIFSMDQINVNQAEVIDESPLPYTNPSIITTNQTNLNQSEDTFYNLQIIQEPIAPLIITIGTNVNQSETNNDHPPPYTNSSTISVEQTNITDSQEDAFNTLQNISPSASDIISMDQTNENQSDVNHDLPPPYDEDPPTYETLFPESQKII